VPAQVLARDPRVNRLTRALRVEDPAERLRAALDAESRPYYYVLRLVAFLLIITATIQKNRS
jgi:hypothetical protein